MKISIVMPVFNGEDFVDAAVDCAQAQTHKDFELIMINDGSSDKTAERIRSRSVSDQRIVLLDFAENRGVSAARNSGLERAEGEWVAIIDADDIYDAHRLEAMLKYAIENELDFVADNQVLFDRAAGRPVREGFEVRPPREGIKLSPTTLFRYDHPSLPFSLGLLKPLIKLRFLRSANLRYQPSLRSNEDFDFYARLLINKAKAALISRPFYQYTMPFGAISRARSEHNRTQIQLQTAMLVSEQLAADFARVLSPAELHALRQRHSALKTELHFEKIKSQQRLPRLFKLAVFLISTPSYLRRAIRFVTRNQSQKTVIDRYEPI